MRLARFRTCIKLMQVLQPNCHPMNCPLMIISIAAEGINLLTAVLRSGEEPSLSLPQMHRVRRAHKAHGEYLKYRNELEDSDDDDGPQDEDAWLYEDLTILVKLYSQLRDKEQLIELIFEVRSLTHLVYYLTNVY